MSSEVVDLDVGRFALRTFQIRNDSLFSIAASTGGWENGACRAECLIFKDPNFMSNGLQFLMGASDEEMIRQHNAPHLKCSCGVYGSLSLESLEAQYASYTQKLVTVIAAEGLTIIGTRGLRTQFARVVACWTARDFGGVNDLPDVTHFTDLDEMLARYDLPRKSSEVKDTSNWNSSWNYNWWTS